MTESEPIFDDQAADYDRRFSNTYLGKYYRKRVQKIIKNYWNGDKEILEINAGTGEDAVFLAELGNRVLATDISPRMLEIIEEKSKLKNLEGQIEIKNLAIETMDLLDGRSFDGLLSNFGGLNCVEDLEAFAKITSKLIKKDGVVILCIMGPLVPWEWVWFSLRLKFKKAFRRAWGKTTWRGAFIRYPKHTKLKKIMKAASFKCVEQNALGVFMPPSYANEMAENWPRFFDLVGRIEERISKLYGMNYLADHYLLAFKRM